MRLSPRHIAWTLALALPLAAVVAAPAHAARAADDKLASIRVQDLHYGDVLFHYWSDTDSGLEALTRLEAYSYWQRMPHHAADAQLLAAGIYLQLGMHNEAGRRFETLLGNNVPLVVRNKAWFYLAKIWYERGYYDRSEQALARIQGVLSPELEAERHHTLVNVLMRQNRFDDAIAQLQGWQGPPDWMAFARFNLGVALVRAGRLKDADPILTTVGSLQSDAAELLSLRDKANLALGFAYLQADQAAQARAPLDRVRLDGPYSSRALLGAGWAHAALGEYREALAPWLALRQRNLLDAAVQESYLAVPYAYSKLNARAQATQYYESALQSFASESQNLDTAITHIQGGQMLDDLLGNDQDQHFGWFWQLKTLPDAAQSRYLYTLLADNDFQEGLKNYRDLGFLQHSLTRWDDSMDAFAAMIDTRERAYAERLPRADALLASDLPSRLRAARAAVDTRLSAIETNDDVATLATADERDQWTRIQRLQEQLATQPASLETEAARDKLRLIKGVLYWQMDASFKARRYAERRSLHDLDTALEELQNRWVRVQRARATVPTDTGDFAARIAALAQRIKDVRSRLQSASTAQSQYLDTLAQDELQTQKARLAAYAVQARFELAQIYDRAADQNDSGAAPPTAPADPGGPDTTHTPPSAPP